MILDYSVKVQVNITMLDYINEILECLDKAESKASGTKLSAGPLNLFVVDEDCEKLSKEKSETFHKILAKMLFATKRAQLNTNTDISYLTTRVREPDQINCLKMVNPLNYVRGTNDIPLILSTDKNRMHKCHIDVSYAVHPNMRGHTGS